MKTTPPESGRESRSVPTPNLSLQIGGTAPLRTDKRSHAGILSLCSCSRQFRQVEFVPVRVRAVEGAGEAIETILDAAMRASISVEERTLKRRMAALMKVTRHSLPTPSLGSLSRSEYASRSKRNEPPKRPNRASFDAVPSVGPYIFVKPTGQHASFRVRRETETYEENLVSSTPSRTSRLTAH